LKKKYRAVFISDTHLGMKGLDSNPLLEFLKSFDSEYLFLVGDIIDGWALKSSWYWPQVNTLIVKEIIKKLDKGCKLFYLPGNHDEFLKEFHGLVSNFEINSQITYVALNGKKYLLMHGDLFDPILQNVKWVAFLGDLAYDILFFLNKGNY